MRRWLRTLWIASALAWAWASSAATAAGPPAVNAGDARAVRTVVEAQLAAFAADDAARAFALAAPAIRKLFGSAQNFIAMVRTGYPVVYRPASVTFLQAEPIERDVLQRVQMTDAAGRGWMAIYRVQRQPDKTWRIGGCELVESQARYTLDVSADPLPPAI